MYMKPKKYGCDDLALLYRRYNAIQISMAEQHFYKTIDNKIWYFNEDKFVQFTKTPSEDTIIVLALSDALEREGKIYWYGLKDGVYKWQELTEQGGLDLQDLRHNIVQKYQLNKYVYINNFSYILSGDVNLGNVEYIKGNITPLTSFDIQFYCDTPKVERNDLVVIDNKLYIVESIGISYKRMPKKFAIYTATLNSIL